MIWRVLNFNLFFWYIFHICVISTRLIHPTVICTLQKDFGDSFIFLFFLSYFILCLSYTLIFTLFVKKNNSFDHWSVICNFLPKRDYLSYYPDKIRLSSPVEHIFLFLFHSLEIFYEWNIFPSCLRTSFCFLILLYEYYIGRDNCDISLNKK